MAVGDTTEAYFTIYNQPKSYTSYFIQGVCFWSWYDAAKCRKVFKTTIVKDRQWALFHWNVEWREHKTISLHFVIAWCDFGKTLHLFARVAIDFLPGSRLRTHKLYISPQALESRHDFTFAYLSSASKCGRLHFCDRDRLRRRSWPRCSRASQWSSVASTYWGSIS